MAAKTIFLAVSIALTGLLSGIVIERDLLPPPNNHPRGDSLQPNSFAQGEQAAEKVRPTDATPTWDLRNFDSAVKSALESNSDWQRIHSLVGLAQSVPLSEVPSAVKFLIEKQHGLPKELLHALLTRWAHTAPADAMAYVQSTTRPQVRQYCAIVSREWAHDNLSDALKWANSLPKGKQRSDALSNVISVMAERDPRAALAMLQDVTDEAAKRNIAEMLIGVWTLESPSAAAEATKTLTGLSPDSYGAITRHWAEQDPQAALGWAHGLSSSKARDAALAGAVESWAGNDPKAAATYVASLPNGEGTGRLATAVAAQWASSDPEGALGWVTNFPAGEGRTESMVAVIRELSDLDPRRAAQLALQLPDRGQEENVIANLAVADPDQAIEWMNSLSGFQHLFARFSIASSLVESDPDAAVALASGVGNPIAQREFVSMLARQWPEENVDSGISWLKALPDGPAKNEGISAMASKWASADPLGAAAYAATLPTGPACSSLTQSVAREWSHSDPAAAVQWAAQLQNDDSGMAVKIAFSGWAAIAPADAANYISTMPPGTARDTATLTTVRSWAGFDPAAAAQWATSIGASQEVLETAAKSWYPNDPASALAWMKSAGVSQPIIDQLTHQFGK